KEIEKKIFAINLKAVKDAVNETALNTAKGKETELNFNLLPNDSKALWEQAVKDKGDQLVAKKQQAENELQTLKGEIEKLPLTEEIRRASCNDKIKEEAEAVRTKVKNRIDNEYDTILRRINEADSNDKVDAETAKISELKKFDNLLTGERQTQKLTVRQTARKEEILQAQEVAELSKFTALKEAIGKAETHDALNTEKGKITDLDYTLLKGENTAKTLTDLAELTAKEIEKKIFAINLKAVKDAVNETALNTAKGKETELNFNLLPNDSKALWEQAVKDKGDELVAKKQQAENELQTLKGEIEKLPLTEEEKTALTNAKNKEEAEAVRTKVKNRIDNEYDTILRRINEADSNDKVDAETAKISELKKFDNLLTGERQTQKLTVRKNARKEEILQAQEVAELSKFTALKEAIGKAETHDALNTEKGKITDLDYTLLKGENTAKTLTDLAELTAKEIEKKIFAINLKAVKDAVNET